MLAFVHNSCRKRFRPCILILALIPLLCEIALSQDLPPLVGVNQVLTPDKVDSSLNQLLQIWKAQKNGLISATSAATQINSTARQLQASIYSQGLEAWIAFDDVRPSDEATLVGMGVQQDDHYRVIPGFIQAVVPWDKLEALAQLPGVRSVSLPPRGRPLAITSEGVSRTSAARFHNEGLTGQAVKVAVLDLGFAGYSARLGSELPSNVIVKSFFGSTGGNGDITGGGEPHGTACAEIVYDMAPGATLYLVNYNTVAEMDAAVHYLVAQGVKIISHSVGFFNTSFYDGTGPISAVVDYAQANGVLFVTASGNSAKEHWKDQGGFFDTDGDGWHEFSPGDETIDITLSEPETISFLLTWNDWPNSTNDYDLYLLNSSFAVVASSTNLQTFTPPAEAITGTITSGSGTFHIAIRRPSSANTSLHFHLFVLSDTSSKTIQYATAAESLPDPAPSGSALTMGAVQYASTSIESFSGQGPTSTGLQKPDLVGPDGVSTATYTTFFGTSAATPHAAGAAALVWSENLNRSAATVLSILTTNATDLGTSGSDNVFGYGMVTLPVVATPPTATTVAATGITQAGATLNGSVNPNGISTNAYFQYGTTTNYGSTSGTFSVGAGTSAVALNFNVTSLSCSTLYHFRIVGQSSAGTTNGLDSMLTTSACPAPSATTGVVTGITQTGATLNGTVNPNGISTTAYFQYGTTTNYGSTGGTVNIGAGTSGVALNFNVTSLSCSTLYHFRIVGQSSAGTTNGLDSILTTSACPAPSATTGAVTGITQTGATLNGTVNPNGISTNAYFQYGTTTNYGSMGGTVNIGAGTSGVTLNFNVASLSCSTLYHFRVVGQSSAGTTNGSDATFMTSTCPSKSAADFDGDGMSDISVWRPSTGQWFLVQSGSSIPLIRQWGSAGDVPVPGDYDGDGKTDFAVWRPGTGMWYVLLSGSGNSISIFQWGSMGDIPVASDYDGDGKVDYGVFRQSTGLWYLRLSGSGYSFRSQQWGGPGDIPVPVDFDGDLKADIAVWRPGAGIWYVLLSGSGNAISIFQWGSIGDVPVAADYDGDGKADYCVFRPSTGLWYLRLSGSGYSFRSQQWGGPGDVPVPVDFDGDLKADIAVWRPSNGFWYRLLSSSNYSFSGYQWGSVGDVPLKK